MLLFTPGHTWIDLAPTISMMRCPHTKHFSAVCWNPEYCGEKQETGYLLLSSQQTCAASHLKHELTPGQGSPIEGAAVLHKLTARVFHNSDHFVSQLTSSLSISDLWCRACLKSLFFHVKTFELFFIWELSRAWWPFSVIPTASALRVNSKQHT